MRALALSGSRIVSGFILLISLVPVGANVVRPNFPRNTPRIEVIFVFMPQGSACAWIQRRC